FGPVGARPVCLGRILERPGEGPVTRVKSRSGTNRLVQSSQSGKDAWRFNKSGPKKSDGPGSGRKYRMAIRPLMNGMSEWRFCMGRLSLSWTGDKELNRGFRG